MGEQGRPEHEQPLVIPGETSRPTAFIVHVPRRFQVYSVDEQELDMLVAGYGSSTMGVLGIAAGGCITSVAALIGAPPSDPKAFASFVAAAIVTGLATLLLSIKVKQERDEMAKKVDYLKRNGGAPQEPAR